LSSIPPSRRLALADRPRAGDLLSALAGATVGGEAESGLRLAPRYRRTGSIEVFGAGLRVTVRNRADGGEAAHLTPGGGRSLPRQLGCLMGRYFRGASVSGGKPLDRPGDRGQGRAAVVLRNSGRYLRGRESSQGRAEHLGESLALARELGTSPSSRSRSSCCGARTRGRNLERRSRSTADGLALLSRAWRSRQHRHWSRQLAMVSLRRGAGISQEGCCSRRSRSRRRSTRSEPTRRMDGSAGLAGSLGSGRRGAGSMVRRPYSGSRRASS